MNDQRPYTGATRASGIHSQNASLNPQYNISIQNKLLILIQENEVRHEQNDKSQSNQLTELEILTLSQLIEYFRLDEQFQQIRTSSSKCSCVGFSTNISLTEQVKQQFVKIGSQQYNSQDRIHKNSVYSILFLIKRGIGQVSQQQINKLTQNNTNFFQLFQFLSCLEFESNLYIQMYQKYGDDLYELIKMIGQLVFEQLFDKKLNQLINLEKKNHIYNILRNYQNGIVYYILKQQNKDFKQLIQYVEQVKRYDPQQIYLEYIDLKKSNKIFSFD